MHQNNYTKTELYIHPQKFPQSSPISMSSSSSKPPASAGPWLIDTGGGMVAGEGEGEGAGGGARESQIAGDGVSAGGVGVDKRLSGGGGTGWPSGCAWEAASGRVEARAADGPGGGDWGQASPGSASLSTFIGGCTC